MHAIDAVIVIAFAAYAITSGFVSRRAASRNLTEYFLAGRTLSGVSAGLSMAATQFAADTPLLVTGLVATAGIFSLWRLWIYGIAFLFLGFVLAASWRRAEVVTDAELTEIRYSGRGAAALRAIKAVYFGLVFNCAVIAMVLFAAKEIAEPFLTWHGWLPPALFEPIRGMVEWVGAPLASVAGAGDVWVRSADNFVSIVLLVSITALYSMTGGLRSVVRTDVVQLAVMLAGTGLYAFFVVREAGGLGAMHESLARVYRGGPPTGLTAREITAFTPFGAPNASIMLLAVFGLQWIVQMNSDGTGYLAQRSMACRSDRDARHAALVFAFTQILVRSLLWLPIGLGLLVLFPPEPDLAREVLKAEREASFVRGMRELLPAGALGILLTAMLAALASTVDTHLNWGASYFTNDLYKRFFCRLVSKREPSERALVRVARVSNIALLLVALLLMSRLSSIQRAWQVSLLLGAGMGVVLVLRWIWWRVTALAEIAAIVASLVLAPLLLILVPAEREALRLLLMAFGSTVAAWITCVLGPAEQRARLEAFYARARPPGFWRPIAEACGSDPKVPARRLLRGVLATTAASLSLFSGLTALGTWIAGSAPPLFWPWSAAAFSWALGLLALGLVPAWVRLGLSSEVADGSVTAR